MNSLQGHLLIASTDLHDPNFAQTVVLIAVHSPDGALGLILNREMNLSLSQVWGQVSEEPCIRKQNVRHGGPVGGTLIVLHDQRPWANLIVAEDLFVATELNFMEALAASDDGQALFYVGHSGWGPGQLETELAEGSWLVLPATPDMSSATTKSSRSGKKPGPKSAVGRFNPSSRSSTSRIIQGPISC